MFNENTINWLREDNNPAVAYRTKTEILDEKADNTASKEWIFNKLPQNFTETKGLWYTYYISALAECGLTREDLDFTPILDNFEYGCADFMYLRALVMMGYGIDGKIVEVINSFAENALPDGGFLCIRRLKSFKYTPKSCYKANIHVLMFLAECKKQGIQVDVSKQIINYFLDRNIFYRKDDKSTLIMDGREGWRIIDTFHPYEPMRIGIHNVMESFSVLGYGNDERLNEAWEFLYKHKDENDKMILSQTLTKSYLPKEKVGKPSKWVTFYTLLAEKEKSR